MSPTAREIFSDALGKEVKETVTRQWKVQGIHMPEGDIDRLTFTLVRELGDGATEITNISGDKVFPDGVFEVVDKE